LFSADGILGGNGTVWLDSDLRTDSMAFSRSIAISLVNSSTNSFKDRNSPAIAASVAKTATTMLTVSNEECH